MVWLGMVGGMCVSLPEKEECSSIITMSQEMTKECTFLITMNFDYDTTMYSTMNQTVQVHVHKEEAYITPDNNLTISKAMSAQETVGHKVLKYRLNVSSLVI